MSTSVDLEKIQSESVRFPSHFQSIYLGTVGTDGFPHVSYAPYIVHEGRYYIYISELAEHTTNLLTNPQCSILFIENEEMARHIFGRKRLTLKCRAQECPRESSLFNSLLEQFQNTFGHLVNTLRNLNDFHLFALEPFHGAYVAGFARAFILEGEDLHAIRHRNEEGHRIANAQTEETMAKLLG